MKRLGEVLKLEYGKPLPNSDRDPNGNYPVYGANGILARSNKILIKQKSIIVGRKGSAGEITLVEPNFWPLDVTYFVTHDVKRTDITFLFYLLKQLNLPNLAKGIKPGINRNDVYAITVAVPPIDEQRRIVALLDSYFSQEKELISSFQQQLEKVKHLKSTILNQYFSLPTSDDGAEPKAGGDIKRLGEVCSIIGGGTPSKANQSFYAGTIPWVTVRDMNVSEISETEFHITEDAIKKSSTNLIPAGNVIIATRVGLGKVCLLNVDAAINQDLKALIPNRKNHILPKYLFHWYRSISDRVIEAGVGATVQGVKLSFVNDLILPVPPIDEQRRIVALLDEYSTKERDLVNNINQKSKLSTDLKSAILQQAFSGEL